MKYTNAVLRFIVLLIKKNICRTVLLVFVICYVLIFNARCVYAKKWVESEGLWYCYDDDGNIIKNQIISYNNEKYYFNDEDGQMVTKYLLEDYEDGNTYYFTNDGKMIRDTWLCIYAEKVINIGSYLADTYWYYFGQDGKAVKAKSDNIKKITIEGKKYIFNEYGQMLTGFLDENGEPLTFENEDNPFVKATYYCGDENDGVVHTGWYNYVYGYETDNEDDYRYDFKNIYLYFSPENGKKVIGKKKINDNEYLFNDEGIMLYKWKAFEENIIDNAYYYGEENDGAKTKEKWIYEIPPAKLDVKAYNDDEKKYFYYDKSGEPVKNKIKKINKEYYAFNKNGIMQKGLVIFHDTNGYVATVDFDYALAEDFMKRGELATSENKIFYIDYDGQASIKNSEPEYPKSGQVRLHYFGDNGDRKIGRNKISFSDSDLSFVSSNRGHKGTQINGNTMLVNGIVAKPNNEEKYGIIVIDNNLGYESQANTFFVNLENKKYIVVDKNGKVVKGSEKAKKGDNDNYWLIGGKEKGKQLIGIWTENVKYVKNGTYTFDDIFSFDESNLPDKEGIYNFLKSKGYVDDIIFNKDIEKFDLTLVKTKKQNEYLIKFLGVSGYMYYDENSETKNKWIPCGVFDRTKNTICVSDFSRGSYQASMSDEFFINCFWQ